MLADSMLGCVYSSAMPMNGDRMPMEPRSEGTLLLRRLSAGDKSALNQLVPLIYRELHQLASGYMRREPRVHAANHRLGA